MVVALRSQSSHDNVTVVNIHIHLYSPLTDTTRCLATLVFLTYFSLYWMRTQLLWTILFSLGFFYHLLGIFGEYFSQLKWLKLINCHFLDAFLTMRCQTQIQEKRTRPSTNHSILLTGTHRRVAALASHFRLASPMIEGGGGYKTIKILARIRDGFSTYLLIGCRNDCKATKKASRLSKVCYGNGEWRLVRDLGFHDYTCIAFYFYYFRTPCSMLMLHRSNTFDRLWSILSNKSRYYWICVVRNVANV